MMNDVVCNDGDDGGYEYSVLSEERQVYSTN